MPDRLMPPGWLPEGLALLRVPQRVLQRGPRHADRPRGDIDPAELEPAHHLPKALAFLGPEERLARALVAVEHDLAALQPLVTELGQVPGDREAGAPLGEQDADAAAGGDRPGGGLAQHGDDVRRAGVWDPRLHAGEPGAEAGCGGPG